MTDHANILQQPSLGRKCKSGGWYFIILVALFSFGLCAALTSCDPQEPFTEEELQRASVYSEGDQFSMAASYGDTLTVTVEEKTLKKQGAWSMTKPTDQVLTYKLSINSKSNGQSSGEFRVRSYEDDDLRKYMFYNLDVGRKHSITGRFDLTTATDTVIINGVRYPKANCNSGYSYSCFSKKNGFLKFKNHSNTFTLILLP